ncbi:hypothetical protein LINPERHAP1_LOCUS12911 [Linum perenne]
MRFTYVVAGWEGSVHDARILSIMTTDSNNQFPMPPLGQYYVVDSGFANAPRFLAPFRGYTAHFQEIRRRGRPKGREENFNYIHSSLRNVIERCCALHNFIRMHEQGGSLFAEFEECHVQGETSETLPHTEFNTSSTHVREMATKRDAIAYQLWRACNASN